MVPRAFAALILAHCFISNIAVGGLLDVRLSDGRVAEDRYVSLVGKPSERPSCNISFNASSTECANENSTCCPADCPYEAGDTTYDDSDLFHAGCFFQCVTGNLCGAEPFNATKNIADLGRYMCSQHRVANCNVTNETDPDVCLACLEGYWLLWDRSCLGDTQMVIVGIIGVLSVFIVLLLIWYLELLCRAHKNPKGLAEGKKYRRAAALGRHQVPYPLFTNLLKEAVGGVGTVLFFNFHFSVFAWGVLLLISWSVLRLSMEDPAAFRVPELITGATMRPSQICRTVFNDHTVQSRHNEIQLHFLIMVYVFTFVFFVSIAVVQYRRYNVTDDDSQMSDFCALCYGLPTMEGDSVESDLLKFFRSELGEDVVGVSVGWDYHHVHKQVEKALEEDLFDLQSQDKQQKLTRERRKVQERALRQQEVELGMMSHYTSSQVGLSVHRSSQVGLSMQSVPRSSQVGLSVQPAPRSSQVELSITSPTSTATLSQQLNSIPESADPKALDRSWSKRALPPVGFDAVQAAIDAAETEKKKKAARSRLKVYLRMIDHGLGFKPPKPKRSGRELWRVANFRLRTALALGGRRMLQSSSTLVMLRKLKTATAVFVVFRTEHDRDRAVKMAHGNGVWFAERRLKIMKQKVEPETVCWRNMYDEPRIWFVMRLFFGVIGIFLLLVGYVFFVYKPYMDAMLNFDFSTGSSSKVALAYSLIVVVGNQIMYFASSLVAEKAGFHFEDTVQATYVILYNLSVLTQTAVDFFIAYRISKNKLMQFEVRAHTGKLFEEMYFGEAITYFTMQKELGFSYIVYCFPSCFLLPFLLEPLFLYLIPYHIQKLLVLAHPWVVGREAERKLDFVVPMDLSRYGDLVLNVVLVSLGFVFLPAGFYSRLLTFFVCCQAWIYIYDQYRVLRYVPGFCISNNLVNKFVEYILAVPNGFMLCACVFRLRVAEEGAGQPDAVLETQKAMAGAFLLHIFLHWFTLWKIVPWLGNTGHKKSRDDYQTFAEGTPASWFSSNPIHCLRSKHVHQQSPPCSVFFRGKEDLLQVNHEAGAYFKLRVEPEEPEDSFEGSGGQGMGSRIWSRLMHRKGRRGTNR